MHRRLSISFYVVVAAALVLAGCGDTNDSGGGAPPANAPQKAQKLDPCTMPTAQELAAVLGGPALEPKRAAGVGADNCFWDNETEDRYATVQLLRVITAPDPDTYGYGWTREMFDKVWGASAKALSGLPDSAWYFTDNHGVVLYVLKGSLGYAVSLNFDSSKDRPSEEALLAVLRSFAEGIAARH